MDGIAEQSMSSNNSGPTRNSEDRQDQPIVACLRCRVQKLKCNRALPTCERCQKQGASCTYPTPPDRKRVAQKANQTKSAKLHSRDEVHQVEPSSTEREPPKRLRVDPDRAEEENHLGTLSKTSVAELPSTEIGLLLKEIFFKRIYTATLMFHKTVSFQVYMLEKMPEYLQRAIFAQAAVFLQEVDSCYQDLIKIMPMPTLFENSWFWARSASAEVLSRADEPSVLKIQALVVLQMFYFSRGELQRAKIHALLAFQMGQLLGYNSLYEDDINRSLQFDHEIRRRSFWASWSGICLNSGGLDAYKLFEKAANIPLPAKFIKGGSIQGVDLVHGHMMSVDRQLYIQTHAGVEISTSLLAELMRLTGIWAKIQVFLTEAPAYTDTYYVERLAEIENLLDTVASTLRQPITDLHETAEHYEETPELLTSVCSLYHFDQLLLHAYMVPIISGNVRHLDVDHHVELVLEHAQKFVDLLQKFVSEGLDITMLWPMTGFAAFMVANVLTCRPILQPDWFSEGLRQDLGRIKTLQTVLEVLSIYWKPLRILSEKLKSTVETARSTSSGILVPPHFPWEYFSFMSRTETT